MDCTMERLTSHSALGICSIRTTSTTQTTSPEHSSVNTQTEIPPNRPWIGNGYLYGNSPRQSASAMKEPTAHGTTSIRLESLWDRLGVVPTGKLSHITHIADVVGESSKCPRLQTDPVILRDSVNSVS